jgi:hypothetical protein
MAVARSALLQRCQSLTMSREKPTRPAGAGAVPFIILSERVSIEAPCDISSLVKIHAWRGPAKIGGHDKDRALPGFLR